MVVGSCCFWARHFMSHSSWGCFSQSVVLWDYPLAQAWLLSVKSLSMFCSSHFSKFYSCFNVPLQPFPVIPAYCDHSFLRFLPTQNLEDFSLYTKPCSHTLSVLYVFSVFTVWCFSSSVFVDGKPYLFLYPFSGFILNLCSVHKSTTDTNET